MNYKWKSIKEIFDAINCSNILYVILRNYEEVNNGQFLNSLHPDIDFLIDQAQRKKFCEIIHGEPRFKKDDKIHYLIKINDKEIVIDVRSTGDGYYDRQWEQKILSNRIKYNDFYVPNFIDYYYSLIYHAILHKKCLTEEYLNRLNSMAAKLNLNIKSEEKHLVELKKYMKKNNYYYTFPYDDCIPFQFQKIDKRLLKVQNNVRVRMLKNKLIFVCSIIKHKVFRIK